MIYNRIKKPLLGITLNRTHRLSKDLVGCWLFNEGCGNKAYDLSGYGNHGTLNGMAFPPTTESGWNAGKFGRTLKFDGADDYISCGNDPSLDITDAITIEAWVEAGTQEGAAGKGIISKMVSGVNTRSWSMYSKGATDKITVVVSQDGLYPTNVKLYSTSISVLDNSWHQVSFTFSSDTLKIYVDGVEDTGMTKTIDDTVASLYSNPGVDVIIGAFSLPSGYFNGSIDGVKIYNRALSASEITQVYRTPFCMYEIDDSWVWQAGKPKPPTGANILAAKLLL